MSLEKIKYKDIIIEYQLTRKKIKNVILRMKQDKTINISAPIKIKKSEINKFLIEKIPWILNQFEKIDNTDIKSKINETINFKTGDNVYYKGYKYTLDVVYIENNTKIIEEENMKIKMYINNKYINNIAYIKRTYEKWQQKKLKEIIDEYIEFFLELLIDEAIPRPTVEYRKMKSRWGDCTPKLYKVKFNTNLIKVPKECTKYVVLHELSHFKYQNHGRDFHLFLTKYMPNWKEIQKKLNQEYGSIV